MSQKHLQYDYDETTTFYGSIVDGVVEDFEVMAMIGGQMESVKILHEKMEEFYKEKFYKWAVTREKNEDDAYDDFKDASGD